MAVNKSTQEVLSVTLHINPHLSSTALGMGEFMSAQIYVYISQLYTQRAQLVTDVYGPVAKLSRHRAAS